MSSKAEVGDHPGRRFMTLAAGGIGLVLILGIASRLAHTATIPNGGLPPSNSKSLANLSAYDLQVDLTKDYLGALTTLNYSAAHALLAPSARSHLTETEFESARKDEGVLGQAVVWPDDETSTRAEYVLGRAGGSSEPARHRFGLKREDGRWWVDGEVPLPSELNIASSLTAAMTDYVQWRAGKIWTASIELLRQEGFEGGQLLLFSYIEPRPSGTLTSGRVAVLTYYQNTNRGWKYMGGTPAGLTAGMGLADVAMGLTTFGADQRYVAYYGVVENTNAVSLTFEEPNGARHSQNLKGQRTVLFPNERNPFATVPTGRPFKSLQVRDVYGNNLRTNPEVVPAV